MKIKSRTTGILCALVLVAICASLMLCNSEVHAAPNVNIVVNSTSNKIQAGDGLCTLREAIKNANTDRDTTKGDCVKGNGDDTIVLGKKQTYTLAAADHTMPDGSGNGLPMITSNLTLQGNGSTIQRRASAAKFRLMWVDGGARLNIFKTNFKYGDVKPGFNGGAMFLNGVTVNLTQTHFEKNQADQGGAIWNGESALSVYDSHFANNTAEIGGAVRTEGDSIVPETNIYRSTFDMNTGVAQAGAIYDIGELLIAYSTFTQNSGGGGGGALYLRNDEAAISNTTLTQNHANAGAALMNDGGEAALTNVTVAGNTSNNGIGVVYTRVNATTLVNTIVASQDFGTDCFVESGTLTANAFNLDSDGTCANATTKTAAEINLGALTSNGGPTQTMLPQAESAAIDAGDNTPCAAVGGMPVYDQRGVVRPQNGKCDVGAVETCPTVPPMPANLDPTKKEMVTGPRVWLAWAAQSCSVGYDVFVKAGSKTGPLVFERFIYKPDNGEPIEVRTSSLAHGNYFWKVSSCNENGCSATPWYGFTVQ